MGPKNGPVSKSTMNLKAHLTQDRIGKKEDSATLDMAKSDTLMKIQNVDGDDGRDDDKGMQDHASSG